MKKIIYATSKGAYELVYPSWLSFIMNIIWKYLKINRFDNWEKWNGEKISRIYLDEFANFKKEVKPKK